MRIEKISYKCDVCGKEVRELPTNWTSEEVGLAVYSKNLDFCSVDCYTKWFNQKSADELKEKLKQFKD